MSSMKYCPQECWTVETGCDTLRIKRYWFRERKFQVVCTKCGTAGPRSSNEQRAVYYWDQLVQLARGAFIKWNDTRVWPICCGTKMTLFGSKWQCYQCQTLVEKQ